MSIARVFPSWSLSNGSPGPSIFAKSSPLPTGITPRAAFAPARINPFTTTCTVPSPPQATTQSNSAEVLSAIEIASPGLPVTATSWERPDPESFLAIAGQARCARPRPATGLWIIRTRRSYFFQLGGRFSMNAAMPSLPSAWAKAEAMTSPASA
jgi:hypothetical protein